MKKIILVGLAAIIALVGTIVIAADHVDAPAVGSLGSGSTLVDITDYYAFESPANANNYVFVCNVSGLTAPASTGALSFTDDLLYEFNIDSDADNVEDLVIQAIFRDGKMIVRGPSAPSQSGLTSSISPSSTRVEVDMTPYGQSAITASNDGITAFAGSRDDPFFMDFFKFVDIVNGAGNALGIDVSPPADGTAYATSFDNSGTDTFAGSNVLSVVIEVPKSMLGSGDSFSSWVESKSSL